MTIIRTQTHERRDTDPVDYILQFITCKRKTYATLLINKLKKEQNNAGNFYLSLFSSPLT